MCFDDSVNNRHMTAPQRCDRQHNADESRRRSPEVTEKTSHLSIMGRKGPYSGLCRYESVTADVLLAAHVSSSIHSPRRRTSARALRPTAMS